MSGNPFEEINQIDLSRLNCLGCGLFLAMGGCCVGGVALEWTLLDNLFPNGWVVPKLLFLIPVLGSTLVVVVGRSILESYGFSIYRGKRKKKRRKKPRRTDDDDDDRPRPKKIRREDDNDDDDRPRFRKSRRDDDDDDDEDDDAPPRRRRPPRPDDDDDEPPRSRRRPPKGDED